MVERIAEARPEGIRSYQVGLVMREAMIDSHKVIDLDNPAKPLALIETNPVEGNYELWPTANRIRQYMDYEIGKPENGGMSLMEFLALPRQWVEFIVAERRERVAKLDAARQKEEDKQRREQVRAQYGPGHDKM